MALGVAMDAAVYAIQRLAASIHCIGRRTGWKIETFVTSRGWLAIVISVPPASENEWDGVPRTGPGKLIPLDKCPPPVKALGSALETAVRNRGLRHMAQIYLREDGERDVWTFQFVVPAPDEYELRKLKQHR